MNTISEMAVDGRDAYLLRALSKNMFFSGAMWSLCSVFFLSLVPISGVYLGIVSKGNLTNEVVNLIRIVYALAVLVILFSLYIRAAFMRHGHLRVENDPRRIVVRVGKKETPVDVGNVNEIRVSELNLMNFPLRFFRDNYYTIYLVEGRNALIPKEHLIKYVKKERLQSFLEQLNMHVPVKTYFS